MKQKTTYTIKSKIDGFVWQFIYHLNGILAEFKMLDGILSPTQIDWLRSRFPFYEDDIKQWQEKLKANFEITIGEPDLSFEALWNLYDDKRAKQDAIKSFGKLKKADVIKLFASIEPYKAYLAHSGVAQAHLATYINKRRFEDEFPQAPPVYKKQHVGKVYNPALTDLANLKTEK